MLKRFSCFFAYLLLVLMPLQGFAAANMSICNSLMQVQADSMKQMQNMPCHKHMASVSNTQSCAHKNTCKKTCKTNCATLCASLSGLTALPSDIKPAPLLATSTTSVSYTQTYTSITQPNLQRPPISFI